MIIKGNPAGSVKYWSTHLLRDDTNTRAEVVEITGLLSEDLPSALIEMEALASQSRCHGNFMYQANINPRDHERLTPEQWREAVDTLEKNLGLEGHQRIVIEHEKEGRVHRHVVWNRVDIETLRVVDMGGNYYTHERTARQLEERFSLEPTPSLHGQHREEGRPERTPELWEQRAAGRSRIDPQQMKAELTEIWGRTDSGKAFASAIEERGYILARGDRRDFCIVDHAGDAHSLARRVEGVRAKDVRDRMADIDRASLPTVTEARDEQHSRFPDHEAAARAWQGTEPGHEDAPVSEKAANDIGDLIIQQLKAADRETSPAQSREVFESQRRREPGGFSIDPTDAAKPALLVFNMASGATEKLADFVGSLLDLSTTTPRSPVSVSEAKQIDGQLKAFVALENIRECMERGERLKASDVQCLTPNHLENIKLRGDDYMRHLIEDIQRGREREASQGNSLER